jgi:hypothetical protein
VDVFVLWCVDSGSFIRFLKSHGNKKRTSDPRSFPGPGQRGAAFLFSPLRCRLVSTAKGKELRCILSSSGLLRLLCAMKKLALHLIQFATQPDGLFQVALIIAAFQPPSKKQLCFLLFRSAHLDSSSALN